MVTSKRLLTTAERARYNVPDSEASDWYRLDVSWENVVNTVATTPSSNDDTKTVGTVVNVTGNTPLFEEAGEIQALLFLCSRQSFGAYTKNFNTFSAAAPHFSARLDFQMGTGGSNFYAYNSEANDRLRSAPFDSHISATESGGGDFRSWEQEVVSSPERPAPILTGDIPSSGLNGHRHLELLGRDAARAKANFDYDGLASSTSGTSGALYVSSANDHDPSVPANAFPFAYVAQTPLSLISREQYSFGVDPAGNADSVFFAESGSSNAAPPPRPLPTSPRTFAIIAHWARKTQRGKFLVRPSGQMVSRAGHILWQHRGERTIWSGNPLTGAIATNSNEGKGEWTEMSNAWNDIGGAQPLDFTALPFRGAISIAKVGANIQSRYAPDGVAWQTPVTVCPYADGTWSIASHEYSGSDEVTIRNLAGSAKYMSQNRGKNWEATT